MRVWCLCARDAGPGHNEDAEKRPVAGHVFPANRTGGVARGRCRKTIKKNKLQCNASTSRGSGQEEEERAKGPGGWPPWRAQQR